VGLSMEEVLEMVTIAGMNSNVSCLVYVHLLIFVY
jgi:hypothetical protein